MGTDKEGYKQINLSLFTEVAPSSMDAMLARMSNEPIPSGILNGLTGTAIMLAMAIVISIPIGIMVGIYLSRRLKTRNSVALSVHLPTCCKVFPLSLSDGVVYWLGGTSDAWLFCLGRKCCLIDYDASDDYSLHKRA